MARERWRGHEIIENDGMWTYADNLVLVSDQPDRKCGCCGEDNREDKCDPCLGKLPGVMNACCGHGDKANSYIQFDNGVIVRGFVVDDTGIIYEKPRRA